MESRCSKCGASASAVMRFSYDDQQVWLLDTDGAPLSGGYAMCDRHADRFTPPVGWLLEDHRSPVRPLFLALEVA